MILGVTTTPPLPQPASSYRQAGKAGKTAKAAKADKQLHVVSYPGL